MKSELSGNCFGSSHSPGNTALVLRLCVIALFCSSYFVKAQSEIPIGTWRLHLSYNTITSVAIAPQEIYGAAQSGILVLSREDNSISAFNTLNGLSETGISCIGYDDATQQLFVGFADGSLDIIKGREAHDFNRISSSTDIQGSKRINHISFGNNYAYLSADFGLVVFDLHQHEIRETWRGLHHDGGSLKINNSILKDDSIFLATDQGIIAGDLNDNLLYFGNWKRFADGDLENPVQSLARFNNTFYAAVRGFGIYKYHNGTWIKENFLSGLNVKTLTASQNFLYIAEGEHLWRVDLAGNITAIETDRVSIPLDIKVDNQDNIFAGDSLNGLVSDMSGSFASYLPDGPAHSSSERLSFTDNKLFALPGNSGMSGTDIDYFSNGQWETLTTTLGKITDAAMTVNRLYLSSYGGGIEQSASGTSTIFNALNSTLTNTDPLQPSIFVTALATFHDELWATNYGVETSLHSFSNGSWQPHALTVPSAKFATDMVIDLSGNVWMIVDPAMGGGVVVYERETGNTFYKTETVGAGGLPSDNVYSICVDRDGYVWTGTDEGVAYFFAPHDDAVKPVFENRFLLRDEKITAIDVDGGNRKWIGTERGAWVFNATGEELVYNFTSENSPLLSNVIRDIEINHQTGEVFFATEKGVISYRADATESTLEFNTIKIFPNPVTSAFAGTVGISGLATDAVVKITDISGRLIWETRSNGGTAAWNVRDYNGRRAATGVYLVFAASADGTESVVGKIAVVD